MAILSVKDPERNGVESMVIRRGDIFYADLRPVVGSEQGGVRPVLIIQNDVGNIRGNHVSFGLTHLDAVLTGDHTLIEQLGKVSFFRRP